MKLASFNRLSAAPAGGEKPDWSLLAGEIAIVLWLWYAAAAFTATTLAWWPAAIWLSLAAPACSWRLGLHHPPAVRRGRALLGRSLLLAPLLAVLIIVAAGLCGPQIGLGFALWLGSGIALLFLAFRLCFWAARATWPGQPLEILRWLAVGGAAFVLLLPYYGRHGFGSGDAYWYVAMLADMVTQVRHGVFPVWVGQSEYAFNGAVSPLRLAPWFQYAGAWGDLVTLHALEPAALVNAVVSASGLAAAASAYLALHAALPRRPGLACVLALLWLASPGVLAPLYAGYQYMEWVAMPFLPILLFGCWRLWANSDRIAGLAIAVGLAGMMLAHTPMALWGGLLAAGMVLAHLLVRRNWAQEGRMIGGMAAVFAGLGSFPIGSVLGIDHRAGTLKGIQGAGGIGEIFPGNFLPIDSDFMTLKSYQLGYTLLGAGILTLGLLLWLRPRGWAAFVVALLAFVPLTVPVPGLTPWIVAHLPLAIMTVDNCPPQRLFGFWTLLIGFALVLAVGDPRLARRSRIMTFLLIALAAGGLWSAREAGKMVGGIQATFVDPDAVAVSLRPENLQLARYAYATFAGVPAYVSQAHMDPLLENRLLDRSGLQLLTANAEAAAPRLRAGIEPDGVPRLAQAGLWIASSDNHSRFYNLAPPLRLEPHQRYALRVDFSAPEKMGVLQIVDHDIFREYALPDSGLGLSLQPQAFGALPTSSHVTALEQSSDTISEPALRFVAPKFGGEQFEFARFWLFSYSPDDLPVRVLSWVPYQAEAATAVPAYLETPRMWQRGWRAEVNGRAAATRESPNHLVMVPLEPGASRVIVTYRPPLWLSAWFWASLAAWAALLGWGASRVVKRAMPCAA